MPHVIMIQGSRGCGKTTFARIISKYYLCQNPNADGSPCGCCEMCESIDDILIGGESSQVECPGVTELDATIMNGKEAIQDALDDALQSPIYSDFKVLIVDECHHIYLCLRLIFCRIYILCCTSGHKTQWPLIPRVCHPCKHQTGR